MDSISDLSFFVQLVQQGSLTALARELGVTPPAVTIRLARMEARLGVRLLNRTTRRLSVTQEGELYLSDGSRLLAELEELDRMVSSSRAVRDARRCWRAASFSRGHSATIRNCSNHSKSPRRLHLLTCRCWSTVKAVPARN